MIDYDALLRRIHNEPVKFTAEQLAEIPRHPPSPFGLPTLSPFFGTRVVQVDTVEESTPYAYHLADVRQARDNGPMSLLGALGIVSGLCGALATVVFWNWAWLALGVGVFLACGQADADQDHRIARRTL